jgi:hypothetical protein
MQTVKDKCTGKDHSKTILTIIEAIFTLLKRNTVIQ